MLAASSGTIHKRRTDLSMKVWDPSSGDERCTIAAAGAPQFVGSSELVAAIAEGELRLWRAGDGQLVSRAAKAGHQPLVFTFSPNGKYLASGGRDADVAVWRLRHDRL